MISALQVVEVAVTAAAATAVSIAGRRRHPPARAAWSLIAAAALAFAAGDIVALFVAGSAPGRDGIAHPAVLPSLAEAGHLTAYVLLVVGFRRLHRQSQVTRDAAGIVDAALIATTVMLGFWVYAAGPHITDQSWHDRPVALAFLLLDVVLLGVTTRLVVSQPTLAVPTLLATSVAVLLGTDALAVTRPSGARTDLSSAVHLGWALALLLLAAAAAHPGASRPLAPRTENRETLSDVRLTLLGAVVLIPPAMIGLRAVEGGADSTRDVAVLSVGLAVVVGLVLVRVALLTREIGHTAERERALRAAAAELVAARDRPGIHVATLRAVGRLVGDGMVAGRVVDTSATDGTEFVAGAGRHVARVRGRQLGKTLLAGTSNSGPTGGTLELAVSDLDANLLNGLALQGIDGLLHVRRVRVGGELLAVVAVVTAAPLDAGTVSALDTLVAQMALAMESATLAADLHERASEARFHALVQNSSDAILLVDEDAAVSYQSPSADRMFGYPSGTLVGHSFEDLCHPDDLPRVQSGLSDVLSSPGTSRRLELRLRRGVDEVTGSSDTPSVSTWFDAEAVANNLQADPNVQATVITVRDVSERKKFENQLTHQAFHDELTGLANRALFSDRVAHALARRERDGTTVAVLLLDLDDFKTVNDGLGHAAGDAMLRAVAHRLEVLVRPGDTTARLGGDEFAMVLVELPDEDAAVHAVERIIAVLGEPLVIEGKEVYVQGSIGLAFAAEGPVSPAEVLRNADAAMYVAKTEGKARYAVFEPHMHAAALHRLTLRGDLQRALDNNEFRLHYQPIVTMETGALVGVEALVRWAHPTRGLVAPDAFIPLADETGLVVPLGQWVLEQACRQLVEWSATSPELSVSVNVSQRQLRRPEFGAEVGDVIDLTGIDPARVALEITESAIMADVLGTVARLHDLRDLGVRVAVDDFGTGYSSFSWLRQLPVDVLKIDKEFIDDLGQRAEGAFLVGAIIDLAHNLGLRTVAEGIEAPIQLTRLRELNCDLGQGYHLGVPMPADEITDLLVVENRTPRHRAVADGNHY